MWDGILAPAWLRLLARNRFAVSPVRIPMACMAVVYSTVNYLLKIVQDIVFAKRVGASVLEDPPIFIIGHWRTGTTHLHQLLTLDERFTAPSTLECFAPAYCLAFGWLLRRLTFLLPAKRPMDNMPVGWEQPQEDEFALLNLGLGSPYEAIIFPNSRRVGHKFLNMTAVAPEEAEAWKAGLLRFLQQVNFRSRREQKGPGRSRRIVLKSPTHTARIHILRQMFPEAKFIHIVRNPCELFPSTVRLWRALYETQGCQKPDLGALPDGTPDLEQYVFDTMDLLYRDFFEEAAQIPAENFCEVRYEDLIRAPVEEMSRIYRSLGLGPFERVRPKLEAHLRILDGYQTNQHRISDHHKAEVCRRWGWYLQRYDYQAPRRVG
jgi:omega-hydroxy-beta-dihydromenaquinone-9 sulfotransferase